MLLWHSWIFGFVEASGCCCLPCKASIIAQQRQSCMQFLLAGTSWLLLPVDGLRRSPTAKHNHSCHIALASTPAAAALPNSSPALLPVAGGPLAAACAAASCPPRLRSWSSSERRQPTTRTRPACWAGSFEGLLCIDPLCLLPLLSCSDAVALCPAF